MGSRNTNIRNFSIIAHIDHGKSTLADRLLELTNTVPSEKMREQFLDQMDLERERGVTIRMQPCTLVWEPRHKLGHRFILNLIDTPGHMDFAYEVERSLSAVEGAILLVDVGAGVQAQTLANLRLTQNQNLEIIPVINKIDICPSQLQLERVMKELENLLRVRREEILTISAKTGKNVEQVLEALVKKVPPPKINTDAPFKALVFDSVYDNYLGIIVYVRVLQGVAKKGERLYLVNQARQIKAKEVGLFKPQFVSCTSLCAGQIGYIATGVKKTFGNTIGETIVSRDEPEQSEALPGYREPESLVFANLFPAQDQSFENLKFALHKLKLNDAALNLEPIANSYLGRGFRVGFLGMFHLEITIQRLEREYSAKVNITVPSVVFEVKLKNSSASILVYSATQLPVQGEIEYIKEPWVRLNILAPFKYISKIHQLVENKRGIFIDSEFLDSATTLLQFEAPLAEIIEDFLDNLKSATQGFGSFSYKPLGYRKSDLVKLEFLVVKQLEPSLSKIVHRSKAQKEAKRFLKKLKQSLPPRNFAQALQAKVGGNIIAREDIRALRKDVTAGLYGGDFSRKKKLLQKQRKGKKELQKKASIQIPSEVYLKLLRG